MSMHITRLADAKPFDPPGHRGVGPVRLQGGEAASTQGITVVLSHYLPGGQAEMAAQPAETVYVVVAGELAVISEGTEGNAPPVRLRTLHRWDPAPGDQSNPAARQHSRHQADERVTCCPVQDRVLARGGSGGTS